MAEEKKKKPLSLNERHERLLEGFSTQKNLFKLSSKNNEDEHNNNVRTAGLEEPSFAGIRDIVDDLSSKLDYLSIQKQRVNNSSEVSPPPPPPPPICCVNKNETPKNKQEEDKNGDIPDYASAGSSFSPPPPPPPPCSSNSSSGGEERGRLIEDDSESIETVTKRQRSMDDDSEFLPPEIYIEILSRLPADSAIGCRGICKQWRSLIDHPSFIESHTRQVISSSSSTSNPKRFGNYLIPNSSTSSSGLFLSAQQYSKKFHMRFIEYNDHVDGKKLVSELKHSKLITGHPFPLHLNSWGYLLISSCNGLVFMGSTKPNYINDMFVCNPFTREYVNLRTKSNTNTKEERQSQLRKKGRMIYGFGYLPSTNEYKIVSIYYPEDMNGRKGKVSVYTLGSGRWRNKGEIPYWLYSIFRPGFFANGAIHWIINYTDMQKIVTFDLADEEFRMVVPSPPSADHVENLGVLGGCLCVTRSDKTRYKSPEHIWVLNVHTKEDGEEEFSWNKRFSIPWKATSRDAEPQVILRSGKVLLLGGTGLISYDPKTGDFNEGDKNNSFSHPMFKVIPYTKSFVSLKALGEEDAKCFGGFVSHALAHQPQQQLQQQQQG